MNAFSEKAKLYWKAILGCVLAIVAVALFFLGIYAVDQPKEAGILYFILSGAILAIVLALIYAQVGILLRIPEGVMIIFSLVIFIGGGVLTVFNSYYAIFIGFGFVSFSIVGILPIFQLPSGMKFLHRADSDTSKHPVSTKRQGGSGKRGTKKFPERIRPILQFKQVAGKIIILVSIGCSLAGPPLISTQVFPDLGFICVFIIWYLLAAYGAFVLISDFVKGLRGRSKFLHGQAQASAKIFHRRIVDGENGDIYYLQLEYTPTLAISTDTLRLEASVSEKLYKTLVGSKTVNIRYALEDPRVFIVEGE